MQRGAAPIGCLGVAMHLPGTAASAAKTDYTDEVRRRTGNRGALVSDSRADRFGFRRPGRRAGRADGGRLPSPPGRPRRRAVRAIQGAGVGSADLSRHGVARGAPGRQGPAALRPPALRTDAFPVPPLLFVNRKLIAQTGSRRVLRRFPQRLRPVDALADRAVPPEVCWGPCLGTTRETKDEHNARAHREQAVFGVRGLRSAPVGSSRPGLGRNG